MELKAATDEAAAVGMLAEVDAAVAGNAAAVAS
jgi:hypothetical protein